jgi:hypothetical protein
MPYKTYRVYTITSLLITLYISHSIFDNNKQLSKIFELSFRFLKLDGAYNKKRRPSTTPRQ